MSGTPHPGSGRRTKIVCTIGPSSDTIETVRALVAAGMNVARLNASHGTHADHRRRCEIVRAAGAEAGVTIAILVDLQGPKIRTGPLEDHLPIHLADRAPFIITTRNVPGDQHCVSTTYENFPRDVKPGAVIFLADGLLELKVVRVEDQDVYCTVVHGGLLGEHKGINLPRVNVSAPALSRKDEEDLKFAIELGADFVALSFVRTPAEVLDLKRRIAALGGFQAVVSKIEKPEAIDSFDKILKVSDAIMLARGDLGVELPLDELPQLQKRIIALCNDAGVPVITATQMLESMTVHPRPTRAEVADVANAIYDGTDAVMLSAETASGRYPVEAVQVMANVARKADEALSSEPPHARIMRMRESGIRTGEFGIADAVCQATCRIANALGARRIVCLTETGRAAALIARYRPNAPVTALTLSDAMRRRCSVIWGVDSARTVQFRSADELHAGVDDLLLERGLAAPGDIIVVAGGIPLGAQTRTNMLRVHRVGFGAAAAPGSRLSTFGAASTIR
jgi:pyruvate kinase